MEQEIAKIEREIEMLKSISDAMDELNKVLDKQNTLIRELIRTVNQLRFK